MIPIDTVSAYTPLTRDSNRIPDPPAFTFGTFPADVAASYYGATHLHGLGIHTAQNISYIRGYFVSPGNEFIFGGEVQVHPGDVEEKRATLEPLLARGERRRISGRAAAIVGPNYGYVVYGHWIAEILPRLALLHVAGYDITSFVYPIPDRTPPFAHELLALAGVPETSLLPYSENEVLQFDELMIPRSPHSGLRYGPILKDLAALMRAGIARANQTPQQAKWPSRLYLARSGPNRALQSRAAIEQIAQDHRFRLIYPEQLSFLEQVMLFENAREIAGEYGSAFHTALFSPPGTVLCGLRGDTIHPGFLQSGFATELDHQIGYIFGRNTDKPARYDFDIEPEIVEDAFRIVFDSPARLSGRLSAQPRPAETLLSTSATHTPAVPPPDPSPPVKTSFFKRLGAAIFGRRTATPPPPPPPVVSPPDGAGVHQFLFGDAPAKVRKTAGPAQPLALLAHVQNIGDTPSTESGWAGEIGSGNAVEGFEIFTVPGLPDNAITYEAISADGHALDRVPLGTYCGTRGENKPLLGFCIYVDEVWISRIAITADAQFTDGGECRDAPAGLACAATSGAALESFRVKLAAIKTDD